MLALHVCQHPHTSVLSCLSGARSSLLGVHFLAQAAGQPWHAVATTPAAAAAGLEVGDRAGVEVGVVAGDRGGVEVGVVAGERAMHSSGRKLVTESQQGSDQNRWWIAKISLLDSLSIQCGPGWCGTIRPRSSRIHSERSKKP